MSVKQTSRSAEVTVTADPPASTASVRLQSRLQRLRHHLIQKAAEILSFGSQQARRMWLRQIRYFYYRFIRLRGTPEAIARGLAVGVFAGCFPLFGLQTVLGVTLAAIFRGSKLMAAAGTWVSNPFTYVPIYAFNLWIGERILNVEVESMLEVNPESWRELLDLGADLTGTLFLGCAIVGFAAACLSYFVGLKTVRWIRHQRKSQRHERQQSNLKS